MISAQPYIPSLVFSAPQAAVQHIQSNHIRARDAMTDITGRTCLNTGISRPSESSGQQSRHSCKLLIRVVLSTLHRVVSHECCHNYRIGRANRLQASEFFAAQGLDIIGIDNDMRSRFFGADASTAWNRQRLEGKLKNSYKHLDLDIRDMPGVSDVFRKYGRNISAVIHTAAQPSHDWAAQNPAEDFSINANGTLNLLEATRQFCPEAVFIFTSTNKVYGDTPNRLPLVEHHTRWEIEDGHEYSNGITETMSVDHCLHSLFGVSKLAADKLVQEYGRYFGMRTACFRGGCFDWTESFRN